MSDHQRSVEELLKEEFGFMPQDKNVQEITMDHEKQNENERLEIVKGILADGYLDINGNRFYFLHQPYVNFDKDENAKRTRYIEKVPDAK